MDSSEAYAICLERIGDPRGIEALQEIFFEGNSVFIGDSLEVLSVIHNKDIPEMPTILRGRKARQDRQKRRREELNELPNNLTLKFLFPGVLILETDKYFNIEEPISILR